MLNPPWIVRPINNQPGCSPDSVKHSSMLACHAISGQYVLSSI